MSYHEDPLTFLQIACAVLKGHNSRTTQLFNATVIDNCSIKHVETFNKIYEGLRSEFPKLYPLYGSKETHKILFGGLLKHIQSYLFYFKSMLPTYDDTYLPLDEILQLQYSGENNENWRLTQLRLEDVIVINKDNNDDVPIDSNIRDNHDFNNYNIEMVLQKYFKS